MISGFLVVNKPKGLTSHRVVEKVRELLPKGVKVGHTGTLDPLATGVLILAIGKATRLSQYLIKKDKCYVVKGRFGLTSNTYDVDGEVKEVKCREIGKEEFTEALKDFKGEIAQVPPPFSAVRVKGKRAYELARQGKEVELPKRRVKIYLLELLEFNYPSFTLKVCCSSGTYIRSLVHDIGKKLNCSAVVEELKRTKVGKIGIEKATTLEEIREKGVEKFLLKPQEVLDFPILEIEDEEEFKQGKRITVKGKEEGLYSVVKGGKFLGVGEVREGKLLPRKVLI